jgi:hypothetical protein
LQDSNSERNSINADEMVLAMSDGTRKTWTREMAY